MRNATDATNEAGLPQALPVAAGLPVAAPPQRRVSVDEFQAPNGVAAPRASWRQNALPFASSLAVHAGVVALGLLMAQAVRVVSLPAVEVQTVAVTSDFEQQTAPDGVANVSLNGSDAFRPVEQELDPSVTTAGGWADAKGLNLTPVDSGGGENGAATDVIIGADPGHGFARSGPAGSGTGKRAGGGPLAPFGSPNGGEPGFLKGPPEKARTVAFVCDASGSMIGTFPALKAELVKAVTQLRAVQGFNIVFFQDGRAAAMSDGLLLATPSNKSTAFNFLDDVSTSGTTDPIPGIEIAFRSRPQLIYLLTDADFPDNTAVLGTIRRLNATKQTKVNTIAFVDGADEVSQEFVDVMKTIAAENGGSFRLVKESDLE